MCSRLSCLLPALHSQISVESLAGKLISLWILFTATLLHLSLLSTFLEPPDLRKGSKKSAQEFPVLSVAAVLAAS